MIEKKYKTLRDIQEKPVEIDSYQEWRDLARSVDGYPILVELGYQGREDFHRFWLSRKRNWQNNGIWDLPLSELLLVLFMEWRKLRFLSGSEDYAVINSLLVEIAEKSDKVYLPDEKDQRMVLSSNQRDVKDFVDSFFGQKNDE